MRRSTSWFMPALILLAVVTSSNAQNTCTKASIAGPYGYAIRGMVVSSNGSFSTFADSGNFTSDANGNLSAASTFSQDGTVTPRTFTGTYTVISDCTGTVKTKDSLGGSASINLVIVDNGQQINFIDA